MRALAVCFQLAYPAFMRSLVGRDRLVEANSAGQASGAAASVVGPGLGGWLVLVSSLMLIVSRSTSTSYR